MAEAYCECSSKRGITHVKLAQLVRKFCSCSWRHQSFILVSIVCGLTSKQGRKVEFSFDFVQLICSKLSPRDRL